MLDQADDKRGEKLIAFTPFTRLSGDIKTGCILLCDHASNQLPRQYGTLGLSADELTRHIAYDIGAAGVTQHLNELLDAPAVMSNFSRLLIDPNRGEDDPTLVMRLSDGAIVPGNAEIDYTEIEDRKANYYNPYHREIDTLIDEAMASQSVPMLVSIHSFTERFKGHQRPWHVAVLWDKDDRLPVPLIESLRNEPDIVVGENEPYSGELKGDCLFRHGTERRLAHALIELRQDLIGDAAGQREWADRIARVLKEILGDQAQKSNLHKVSFYGTKTEHPSADRREERSDD